MPRPDGEGHGVWGSRSVRGAAGIGKEASAKGITRHFGRVTELLSEKSADIADGDLDRETRARAVFPGRAT